MAHEPLICRDCFTEADIQTAYGQPDTESEAKRGFVCPNCGCESFGI